MHGCMTLYVAPYTQARFKYPCHWVPLESMFDSMSTLPGRGYMTVRRQPWGSTTLFTLGEDSGRGSGMFFIDGEVRCRAKARGSHNKVRCGNQSADWEARAWACSYHIIDMHV